MVKPERGYMRAQIAEWMSVPDDITPTPDGAPGDPEDPLVICELVTAEMLAEAFDGESLVEQLEAYAYDNALIGEGGIDDFFDTVDGFSETLQTAIRRAVVDGITASRYYKIEEVRDMPEPSEDH